ncbi:hypothetical protein BDC45DRAFT_565710 [Circinella umbellata]|nr:hypothetical protein BDC45DRAFT_565710 [Circinella umbellata]
MVINTNNPHPLSHTPLCGREATSVHLFYHMMGFVPATVTTSGNFMQYIRIIGEFHTEMYNNYNFHYRHREMHMQYFGAHRSALEMLVNLLIGVDEENDLIKIGVIQIEIRGYVQTIAGYRRNVYPYRWCRHCERGIDENGEDLLGRVKDRDLNAANNIERVLTAYINSNGDPDSRPLYLRRPANQNQHIDAQMQEEELVREKL